MATSRPRYTVSVDEDLFRKIEDFRFEKRFQTRSEATVELIRLGLEALKREDENYKRQNDILYHFGNSGFHMENQADKESLRLSYQDIRALYQDEKFWYICMKGGELHMVGKGDVLNYDGRFGMFLEKQSGLKLKNAKTTVLERIQIMQGRKKSLEEDRKKHPRKGLLP